MPVARVGHSAADNQQVCTISDGLSRSRHSTLIMRGDASRRIPGTTVMMSGAEARTTARSVAAHTTPPQPLTSAAFNRSLSSSSEGRRVAGQYGHGESDGAAMPALLALAQASTAALSMTGPPACMDRQVPHAQESRARCWHPERCSNVVQLYIKEHRHTEVPHRANCFMSIRAKELQTYFRNSDVRLYCLGNRHGAAQIAGVKCDHEPVLGVALIP